MEDLFSGRPQSLSCADNNIVRRVRKNPLEGAVKIAHDTKHRKVASLSASSVRRALYKSRLHVRTLRKKPLISRKKLLFVKKYEKMDFAF